MNAHLAKMICTLGAFALIGSFPCFGGTTKDASDPINNLAPTYDARAIGDLYTDGINKFLCIVTKSDRATMLNLSAGTSFDLSASRCPSTLIAHIPNVTLRALNPIIDSAKEGKANFVSGSTVSMQFDNPTNHCGSNIRDYYTVTYSDGSERSFYVAVRLQKPTE
jgi:hypothetical protein